MMAEIRKCWLKGATANFFGMNVLYFFGGEGYTCIYFVSSKQQTEYLKSITLNVNCAPIKT